MDAAPLPGARSLVARHLPGRQRGVGQGTPAVSAGRPECGGRGGDETPNGCRDIVIGAKETGPRGIPGKRLERGAGVA
jgi:hypothetical protein